MLFNDENELTTDICNMNETHKHNIEPKNQDTKELVCVKDAYKVLK